MILRAITAPFGLFVGTLRGGCFEHPHTLPRSGLVVCIRIPLTIQLINHAHHAGRRNDILFPPMQLIIYGNTDWRTILRIINDTSLVTHLIHFLCDHFVKTWRFFQQGWTLHKGFECLCNEMDAFRTRHRSLIDLIHDRIEFCHNPLFFFI